MRVNVYAEEMTDRVEIISKATEDGEFTGVRFYLELPCTIPNTGRMTDMCGDPVGPVPTGTRNVRGPFIHRPGDDDSSAVTFWGKRGLEPLLETALEKLRAHRAAKQGSMTLAAQAVRSPLTDMGCAGRGIAAHYTLGYRRRSVEAADGVEAYHVCPNAGCSLFDKEVA